ncbi:major facilitator superfamily domain-containing protein [Mariannaea sp. PMI_226]|nr:major facilitator superfamily domain-containing protein [Mariannaea sp. PMI_226]
MATKETVQPDPPTRSLSSEYDNKHKISTLYVSSIDLYVVPSVAIIWLFCFIDRANIGNARIAGYDYNILLSSTIFYKWIGPGWFILATTLMFGVCTIATGFYRRAELAFRLSLYLIMSPLAGAFGGLLASGILKLDSFSSLTEWRMIFGIEGIITYLLGVIGFFTITDRPETAQWLSEEEKEICRTRIQSERLVQTGEVLDKVDKLYSVPLYIVGSFMNLAIPALSWRVDRRQIFLIGAMPTIIIRYILFLASESPNVRYVACFLIASTAFIIRPLSGAQVSANVVSDTSRSSAIATNVLFGNTEAPNYPTGNGLNLASLIWFKWDNRKRRHRNPEWELAGLTQKEIEDLNWKHPAFRWRP